MNCPNCKLEISDIDKVCPFCGFSTESEKNGGFSEDISNESVQKSIETETLDEAESVEISADETELPLTAEYEDAALDEAPDNTEITASDDESQSEKSEAAADIPETGISVAKSENAEIPDEIFPQTEADNLQSGVLSQTTPAESESAADSKGFKDNPSSEHTGFIEKLLNIFPGHDRGELKQTGKSLALSVISSFPFAFWILFAVKKKSRNMIFFANQSFILTVMFIFNCAIWLLLNLCPFTKTVSYEAQGVVFFKSVGCLPWFAAAAVVILFVIWALLTAVNVCCAVNGRMKQLFPERFYIISK